MKYDPMDEIDRVDDIQVDGLFFSKKNKSGYYNTNIWPGEKFCPICNKLLIFLGLSISGAKIYRCENCQHDWYSDDSGQLDDYGPVES